MARFAFISYGAWGHIDFGGQSLTRTAAALLRRGHSLTWILLRGPAWHRSDAVRAELERLGFTTEWVDAPAGGAQSEHDATDQLRERLTGADACVIDRLASFAAQACRADQPWAAVGADGRNWRMTAGGLEPASAEEASLWCVSPFLNLSFLPRSFWGVDARPHTHFVGCGEQERSARRSEILVTLGNTFPPAHRARVIEALRAASASVGGPWHFLGEGIWEPYPVAFARARLAVGHGGNIFLWQAMAEGIPVIAISGGRADQAFGARAVERLGIGTAISLHEASAERIAEAIRTLLADGQAESRARRMHRILRSGGGVAAAVRLLEALAEQCTAVEQCVPDGCCCREAAEAF